ncbi:MAG: bifunctional proline dehydrogenase/L-glutamate gamma-semialdehyde dehydrogenase PutA, partial [Alphaproteobacteria bacterium]
NTLAGHAKSADIRNNPGISIKLSALHPRYEVGQKEQAIRALVERTLALALAAKNANIELNIDAEEADRLDLSLDIIEPVLRDPRLAGWDGFGVVVQAYGKRAGPVIDWLQALASELDRKITVRLVKGAYWDTEIKRAQVEGLADFPVFTHKSATDIAYICCAQKLLNSADRIYPQFATHNAHTMAAVLELANDKPDYEFQRLHGMGDALHDAVRGKEGARCRIYAPVGAHRDLLAYLVRRLLENGANSSFVNQIVDTSVPASTVAADPFDSWGNLPNRHSSAIRQPADLFAPERRNSRGWDLHNEDDIAAMEQARDPFKAKTWTAEPLLAVPYSGTPPQPVLNPGNPNDTVGQVMSVTEADTDAAIAAALNWASTPASERADILVRASELYENHAGELFAVLAREAGKTPADAIGEIREAVDFLRYYAAQIDSLAERSPRGIVACISPWNFPLAIFTGQIAAALAAGNGVLAKPAEATPITASIAVGLLHEAGVPRAVLQLVPGEGPVVGARLSGNPRIDGLCFTGSTDTARMINRSMAGSIDPGAPLIAETGGLNAMIVDSTALPEQAVRDIVTSAFQSAGQRCSALRILYLQEDIAEPFLAMLYGAMDELIIGDPWRHSTDIGPVIDAAARTDITNHIEAARHDGRLLKQLRNPGIGHYIGPAVIKVPGIVDLDREIFGPVLHIARFGANEIDAVVDAINGRGFGLTFGLHTRIDDRVEQITSRLNVGNMYINRNQIGAVVGSQPFGGEGLSGTGPKAGGPAYVRRLTQAKDKTPAHPAESAPAADTVSVQAAIDQLNNQPNRPITSQSLPGPTGESNRLSHYPRGVVLCLGPTLEDARRQAEGVRNTGGLALVVAPGADRSDEISGTLNPAVLSELNGFAVVAMWRSPQDLKAVRIALAQRAGPLVPLVTDQDIADYCLLERHICIDTTAAGGNASLLASAR